MTKLNRNGSPIELTPAEACHLKALALGWTANETASCFSIAPSTVRSHRSRVFRKLGVSTAAQAAAEAFRLGLADPSDDSHPRLAPPRWGGRVGVAWADVEGELLDDAEGFCAHATEPGRPSGSAARSSASASSQKGADVIVTIANADGEVIAAAHGHVAFVGFKEHRPKGGPHWTERVHKLKLDVAD